MFSSYFYCFVDLRYLLSFPTRRSSDLAVFRPMDVLVDGLHLVDRLPFLIDPEKIDVANADSWQDRKSTRLNSSHLVISYAVFCLKKKKLLIKKDNVIFSTIWWIYVINS